MSCAINARFLWQCRTLLSLTCVDRTDSGSWQLMELKASKVAQAQHKRTVNQAQCQWAGAAGCPSHWQTARLQRAGPLPLTIRLSASGPPAWPRPGADSESVCRSESEWPPQLADLSRPGASRISG